jgi:hypothetical protein
VAECSARHSLQLEVRHISTIYDRRPTWLDISADGGTHLDTANTCCKIFPKARFRWGRRYREDVFGNPQRSRASRKNECVRCIRDHRCRVVQWRFRSNMSNTGCKKFHGRRCHRASRSVPFQLVGWLAVCRHNNWTSKGSRTLR